MRNTLVILAGALGAALSLPAQALELKVLTAGAMKSVVTALQQPRVFEWRFSDRYGVKGLERWELERVVPPSAQRAPRTLVRMRSDYTMPGLIGKAMDWLMTRHAVARRNQDYLARLKRYAEHGSE